MFPYENRLRWWIRGRHRHLVDAIAQEPELLEGRRGASLQRRLVRIEAWLKVRIVLLVLLSFSLVASITSTLIGLLPEAELAQDVLRVVARVANGSAGLFSALYLLTLRTLGQLEIDVLLMLHTHHLRN